MGGLGVRAAPAIVGQVRRAEKNEKAGRSLLFQHNLR